MRSGLYGANDRAVLHTLAYTRARGLVGICGLLSGSAVSDEEYEALNVAAEKARDVRDMILALCEDAKADRQIGLF